MILSRLYRGGDKQRNRVTRFSVEGPASLVDQEVDSLDGAGFEEELAETTGALSKEGSARRFFGIGTKTKDGILLQSGRDFFVDPEREDRMIF